jgi:hypothetical protein
MNDEKDKEEAAYLLLLEFYQNVDEIFLGYFISLTAPQAWRPKLDQYAEEYKGLWVTEIGLNDQEAEKRVEDANHMFGDGVFRAHTTTSKLRKILSPGVFEDLQAKNAIKLIYDSWESTYRPQLEKLVGQKIQGDIWGDLRHLRNSIAHRDSKGVDEINKAKLIKNFIPGQKITLTQEVMAQIQIEIENWYTEFQFKYRTNPKSGSLIARIDIPSGRARTFGLGDLKHAIRVFGIGRSKNSSNSQPSED